MSTLTSDEKEFIFFHTYKVAGTSITKMLAPYCRASSPIENGLRTLEILFPVPALRKFGHHVKVRDLEDTAEFGKYFKFAFVRNPWDWQVSNYHFMRQGWKVPKHFHTKFKSFDEYIEWRCFEDRHTQYDFLACSDGQIRLDFIGKFENILGDWVGLRDLLKIQGELPHVKASRHNSYRSYYSRWSRDLVAKSFEKDIEYFSYEF